MQSRVYHSQTQTMTKSNYSWAPSYVRQKVSSQKRFTFPLMMEAQMVSETLDFYSQLTWLAACEELTEFSCHESFKSYKP
jgi:hypothetical protein